MIISINDIEYNLDIDHTYNPGTSARMAFGQVMEAAEPAHIEITSVKMEVRKDDWQELILPDKVIHDIEREIMRDYE